MNDDNSDEDGAPSPANIVDEKVEVQPLTMPRNAANKKKQITFTSGSVLDKPAGLSIDVPNENEKSAAAQNSTKNSVTPKRQSTVNPLANSTKYKNVQSKIGSLSRSST